MKKTFETIIIVEFVLFILGGFSLVIMQILGLLLGNSYLIVHAKDWFAWIYPCAAITGLMCYVLSYRKEEQEKH